PPVSSALSISKPAHSPARSERVLGPTFRNRITPLRLRLRYTAQLRKREGIQHVPRAYNYILPAVKLIRHRPVADRRGQARMPQNASIRRIECDEVCRGIPREK